MDILSIAQQLFGAVQQNPQTITNLVEHPYSTTQQVTGSAQQLNRTDMSQVITMLAALMGGAQPKQQAQTQQAAGLDLGALANAAQTLLGQNNNSVHDLASTLFSVPTATQGKKTTSSKKTTVPQALTAQEQKTLQALLAKQAAADEYQKQLQAQQAAAAQQQSQGLNLNSLVNLGSLAGALMGSQPKVDLTDGVGLDDIAGLAGMLFKK